MLKSKLFFVAFITFVISIFFVGTNFATQINKNEITDWKVSITSDTKDIKNTQEISFEVEEDQNVVNGKIAPGGKATAEITIDVTGTNYLVDILAKVDDSELFENLKVTAELNKKKYKLGEKVTLNLDNSSYTEENGKIVLKLVVEWENNNKLDSSIGTTYNKLKIPVTIEVKQHI